MTDKEKHTQVTRKERHLQVFVISAACRILSDVLSDPHLFQLLKPFHRVKESLGSMLKIYAIEDAAKVRKASNQLERHIMGGYKFAKVGKADSEQQKQLANAGELFYRLAECTYNCTDSEQMEFFNEFFDLIEKYRK